MDVITIINHPGFGALLFVLLALWPVGRILRRAGHSPKLAALLFLNLAVPLLGLIALGIVLCRKPRAASATATATEGKPA